MQTRTIVFDFDGTMAKSTTYHRSGWEAVIRDLGISSNLNALLPYEPNLRERFDSYRRIESGFLGDETIRNRVYSYFGSKNDKDLPQLLMNLKESFTINAILKENINASIDNLGLNLILALNNLKDKKIHIGIISSTRETIINSYLYKCGLLGYFDFILGEETLTNSKGSLLDKPNIYAKRVLKYRHLAMDLYVGDSKEIDMEFSKKCGVRFVLADYKTDFADLLMNNI